MRFDRWGFAIITFLLMLLCVSALGQTPGAAAPAAPAKAATLDPAFAIELGTGHIWTGSGNYAYNLDSAQWQVHLAASCYLTPHHGIMLAVGRDGATIIEYLHEHNFTTLTPKEFAYRYTIVDLAYRYTINPDDKAKIFLMLGPSGYFAGDLKKAGIMAGAGLDYGFTPNWFASVKLSFRHVAEFIVPQANVIETRLSVGYRF